MPTKLDFLLTPSARAWLYRVGAALVALALVYQLIDGAQATAWLGLLVALTGLSVAAAHTPTSKRP